MWKQGRITVFVMLDMFAACGSVDTIDNPCNFILFHKCTSEREGSKLFVSDALRISYSILQPLL